MGEPTESQIRLHTCKEPEKKSRTYHKDHYLHCYEKSMQFETPSIEVSETKVVVSAPNAKIECQALPDVEITEIVCEDKLQVKGFKLDQAVDLCWKSCGHRRTFVCFTEGLRKGAQDRRRFKKV
jgi:hypothetical protein